MGKGLGESGVGKRLRRGRGEWRWGTGAEHRVVCYFRGHGWDTGGNRFGERVWALPKPTLERSGEAEV